MERLQRVMAARGSGSRRDAEALIVQGRVTVDGQRVTELGTRVDPVRAVIRVDGKELRAQRDRTIILHKPAGYITTVRDERDRWTVMDLVNVRERVYPVGRLDRDTEGLLVLTNNGDLANRIMHPRFQLTKEYHVLTTVRPDDRTMQRVRDGVLVDGQIIQPDEFRLLRQTREGIWLTISLHVGMYHVIRRMMEAVKIPVERLTRVRVGPLGLEGIAKGTWRDLTPGEAAGLAEAVHLDEPAPPVSRPSRPRSRPEAFGRPEGRRTPVPVAPNRPAPERTFGLRPKTRVPASPDGEPMRLVGDGGREDSRGESRAVASGPARGGRFAVSRPPDRGRDKGEPDGRVRGDALRPTREERGGRGPGRSAGPGTRRDDGREGIPPEQTTSGRRSRGMTSDRRNHGVETGRMEGRDDTRGRRWRQEGPGTEREERPGKGQPTGGRRAGRTARPDRMGRPDPSGRRSTKAARLGRPAPHPARPGAGRSGRDRPDRGEGRDRRPVAPGRGGGDRGSVVIRRNRFGGGPEFGDRPAPRDEERQEQREHDRHDPRSPEGDHDRRPRRGRKEHRRSGTG